MTIPAEIIAEKNKLSNTSPWLILLKILLFNSEWKVITKHFTKAEGDANVTENTVEDTTIRLTSNLTEVVFQTFTYYPFPMEVQMTPQSLAGDIPEVNISVSNADRVLQGTIESLDGAVDSEVIMYIVHAGNLASDFSDFERHFKILSTMCNNEWVTFSLGLMSPTFMRYPLFRTMGSHCNWLFKGVECTYSGGTVSCDHTLKTCQSLNNSVHFGGFPGLNTAGVKFVG